LDNFITLVEDGMSVDEARRAVAEEYGLIEAQKIYDYWRDWPPGRGCDPAVDQFFDLVERGNSPDEAARLVADRFSPVEAQQIYEYWCSWPPGRGCFPARDRFEELLEEAMTEEQARAKVTEEFGAEEVEAQFSRRAAVIDQAAMGPTAAAAMGDSGSPEPTPYFLGDVLTWPWETPGIYRVRFEVRDMEADELIEQSEVHEIVVKLPQPAADAQGRTVKDKDRLSLPATAKVQEEEPRRLPEQPTGQGQKRAGDKINDFFQSFETAGLALAFLMFPLVLTLATELHRGRPLTQSTIKPAFYAQCLYLSPFVVSIWIPILLYRYHPEPEEEFGYALILAVVIFLWLVIAEIRFVRGERTVSRFRSIL
jgi:hypothetical protein